MVEAFSRRIVWNFPHTYPGVLQKDPSSFRPYGNPFITLWLWAERCFRYLSATLHFVWRRTENRLAENEKSFAWDWKIIRLRTFYRFPQWKKAERCLKHPSFCNILYHNLLSYNLKDEGSFLQNLGECVGNRICGCRSTYTKIGGKACLPFLLSYSLFNWFSN